MLSRLCSKVGVIDLVLSGLGYCWAALGWSWVALGLLSGGLGLLFGCFWVLLGCSWVLLGRSWGVFGVCLGWGVLGALLDSSWMPFGVFFGGWLQMSLLMPFESCLNHAKALKCCACRVKRVCADFGSVLLLLFRIGLKRSEIMPVE